MMMAGRLYAMPAALLLAATLLSSCSREDEPQRSQVEASALPMKPGLWKSEAEFTDAEMTGIGDKRKQELLAEMSNRLSGESCLTPEQAKKPDANFFAGGQSDDCKYSKFEVTDGRLDVAVSCSVKSMATLDMSMTGLVYESEYNLDIQPELRLPMIGKVTLNGKIKGRYLGPCGSGL
ncbi:DUF3617 domain-containing protein [Sphingorhabdus arenilitoris]|uniref:DUF3617 domain-containing protein n=1 Tax=Sphingorhabdus arenilitoris TaxID=1490041 RepID=A0ABV8RJG6_9SPHN